MSSESFPLDFKLLHVGVAVPALEATTALQLFELFESKA